VTKAKTKIKPETYKQAWSVSEQHLLERLLDEIPEGEKNRCVIVSFFFSLFFSFRFTELPPSSPRWQKISLAMQGRRTPRQVASRVQKYFEKLKRFGVGVRPEDPAGEDGPP
jgi:hypothetical protein